MKKILMLSPFLLLCLLAVFFLSTTPASDAVADTENSTKSTIEAEDHAVYNAVIYHRSYGMDKSSSIRVLADSSSVEYLEYKLDWVGTIPAGLIESYHTRNAEAAGIELILELEQDIVLLPAEEQDENSASRVWNLFRFLDRKPKPPRGQTFSLVGYSASKDIALIYVENQCDDLCGSGYFYLLEKVDGVWTVRQGINIWIS